MSRRKGATFERAVCKFLRDELGGDYCRNLKQYQQSQHGDIEQLVGPYLVECKNHANLNDKAAWLQAVAAALKRQAIPCVAFKHKTRLCFRVPSRDACGSWVYDFEYTDVKESWSFALHVREMIA